MANIFELEFGGAQAIDEATGVRVPATAPKKAPKKAPPNASAAPKTSTSLEYTGLCAAMNYYEQQLVKKKTVEFANMYTVEFGGGIENAKVILPGSVDKSKTPGQNNNTAQKLDPKSNSMNTQGRNWNVLPGTQIVQFIEQVVRNSEYITKQQKAIIDQTTGKSETSSSVSPRAKSTTWFKISVNTKIIGNRIDTKRNDYAYHLTYIVTPYAISQAESQYFNQAKYRGVHKVYNYWFTGQNTQVLHFEQNFNALFGLVVSGSTEQFSPRTSLSDSYPGILSPWSMTKTPTTRAAVSDKGATNGANNPAATLADFLYNTSDMGIINLKIMGDPAWIQQGEIVGINATNFNYQGFYPDGTINSDAQKPSIAFNWNAPADYDNGSSGPYSGTGLMNVNASATRGNPNNLGATQLKISAAFQINEITSSFTKGKFEQELSGVLISNLNQSDIATIERLSPSSSGQITQENTTANARPPKVPQAPPANPIGWVENGGAETDGGAAVGNPRLGLRRAR